MFNRRQFLQSSLGATLAAGLPLQLRAQGGAVKRVSLGETEVILLDDGYMQLPMSFILPEQIDDQERSAFIAGNKLEEQVLRQPCTLALWKTPDRTILFDAGGGMFFLPTLGRLVDSLAMAGIDVAQITDVVFTHAHPDHLWGLIDDFDELIFPDANYYMNSLEWDYWQAESTLANTPAERQSFVVGAQNRMTYLEERIQLFSWSDEVLQGVEAIDTSGHTPGHTSFGLHSGSESLLVLGDALTHPAISFQKPAWPSGSDQDPQKGIDTRLGLLDRVVADKQAVVGFHLPNSGYGFVEAAEGAYLFVNA